MWSEHWQWLQRKEQDLIRSWSVGPGASHLDNFNRVHNALIAMLSDHGNDHFVFMISEVCHFSESLPISKMTVTGNCVKYPKQQTIVVHISIGWNALPREQRIA